MSIGELVRSAPDDAVVLARSILEQSLTDQEWADQIGPGLAQRDVARLLDKSEQAVSKDARLVRIRNRDGRPTYPVFQFDGRGLVDGVAEVVTVLFPVVEPLTVAAWLTGTQPGLNTQRPIDALRRGETVEVIRLASQFAAHVGR